MGYFCVLRQQQRPSLQGSGVTLVPTSISSFYSSRTNKVYFLCPSNLTIYLQTTWLLINWEGNDVNNKC